MSLAVTLFHHVPSHPIAQAGLMVILWYVPLM